MSEQGTRDNPLPVPDDILSGAAAWRGTDYGDGLFWNRDDGLFYKYPDTATMTAAAPRCPSCGAAMVYVPLRVYTKQPDGSYIETQVIDDAQSLICLRCDTALVPTTRPRVPCPACGGRSVVVLVEVVNLGEYRTKNHEGQIDIACAVCRGRGTVSAALATAWSADREVE